MSESASALFSIADAGEFRFARFYIVCEEVPLGTPESPLIVCSLSDTLRECPNVAKTRNGMPDVAWKKYTNFASKNLPPSVLSGIFRYLFFGIFLIPHPFPLWLAITGTCRIGRRVCRMRCIALGALHAAGHVGERGRCIVRFDKAGALDGIFTVAGADGVDCHI